MAHSDQLNEIPFEQDSGPRYALWIIGFMTFLLGLVLVGAMSLGSPFQGHTIPTGNIRMTVEIPSTKETSPVPAVLQVLQTIPGVASANQVDPLMLTQLLEPWVGQSELLKDLPVPFLIDVEVRPDSRLTATELAQFLRSHAAGIRVEEHGPWQQSISLFQQVLQMLTYAVAMMIIGIIFVTITLVTRNALTTFQPTVNLLHVLGASRHYISRQFLTKVTVLGVKASVLGFMISIPGVLGLRWAVGRLGVPDSLGYITDADVLAILIAAPIIVSLLTIVVSRSVLARLLIKLDYT